VGAGLVLDYYVVFLIKLLIRVIKMRGSSKWPVTIATVTDTNPFYGGKGYPTAEVAYSYEADGNSLEGQNTKPFVALDSAERYVTHFPLQSQIKIRVKPGSPSTTVIRNQDQPSLKMKW
jgi:hypothetical protein